MFALFLGILVSYTLWSFSAGKYEGDKIEQSMRFKIGGYYLHIHHWMIGVILFCVLCSIGIQNDFLIGLALGTVLQGITYRDRGVIFYKQTDFAKIYDKWKPKK